MKTTFKKTMAALSAAAVVAASAAVMAVPASAASDCVVSLGSVEYTVSELEALGNIAEMPILLSNNPGINNIGFLVSVPGELTFSEATAASGAMDGTVDNGSSVWFAEMATKAITSEQIGSLKFEVSADAIASVTVDSPVVIEVGASATDANGDPAPLGQNGVDLGLAGAQGGTITIVADPVETTVTTTTEAPAAPVETTTTTAAPVATPVEVATTTTKAPASSAASPKTGDALPVAGVAVAVAVIGGVALVSKKRK